MNLVKMVAIYLLTVLSEGENIRFVFIGSLVLSHHCLAHLAGW